MKWFAGFVVLVSLGLPAPGWARPKVLDAILERVEDSLAAGERPAVVFDLDDTLLDNHPRSLEIFRDLARLWEPRTALDGWRDLVSDVRWEDIRYEPADTLRALGISDEAFIEETSAKWRELFFANDYLSSDEPVAGAVEYVQELADAGARIYYVTGRDEPRMGEGTRESLRELGFPLNRAGTLVMKDAKETDDLEFKRGAFARIRARHEVVGAFENEPRNVNLMKHEFAEATVVFLDTQHSNRPDVPEPGIRRIKDFE
jgi:phosphoserine phosphatase